MFFRRNRVKQVYPSWLKWVIVGFLALAFFGNFHKTPASGGHDTAAQPAKNLNPKTIFSDYKSKMFPGGSATFKIEEREPGAGTPAVCGQQVSIAYERFPGGDEPLNYIAAKETLEFRIGDGKVASAFEQGVVGMKQGGKRGIFAPPSMAGGPDEAKAEGPVRFEIELLKLMPILPDAEATPFRIAVTRPGNGVFLSCGEKGNFNVTLWSVEGKKLFEGPVAFAPGKSEVFLGLEQGVIGISPGEARTLVIPPAFQKTMDGNKPTVTFPLPKDQTILVDVEALP